MRLKVKTNKKELTVCIPVTTSVDADIRIEAFDQDYPKTYFITRNKKYKGTCLFKIRLPISPEKLVVNVYNAKNGNQPLGKDKTFVVGKVYGEALKKPQGRVSWDKYNLKDFVDFACRFCYNLSYLDANKMYQSDGKNFTIELLPTIKDSSGKTLNTPARINKTTGKIQMSKSAMDGYTVPSRFAILCHEMAHFHINENPDDESEADLNGLTVYLSLGFPVVEAYDAFADIFLGAPTEENKKRYEIIDKFIRTFEKQKIVLN